jgi:hypothetical protein
MGPMVKHPGEAHEPRKPRPSGSKPAPLEPLDSGQAGAPLTHGPLTGDVRAAPRADATRCPFCHDDFQPSMPGATLVEWRCDGCQARYHLGCAVEAQRSCVVCAARIRDAEEPEVTLTPVRPGPRWQGERVRDAGARMMLWGTTICAVSIGAAIYTSLENHGLFGGLMMQGTLVLVLGGFLVACLGLPVLIVGLLMPTPDRGPTRKRHRKR